MTKNDDIFLTFPRKQDLEFDTKCLLKRQFYMSNPVFGYGISCKLSLKETICICQILFSEKNKEKISKWCLLKLLPRELMVKSVLYQIHFASN